VALALIFLFFLRSKVSTYYGGHLLDSCLRGFILVTSRRREFF